MNDGENVFWAFLCGLVLLAALLAGGSSFERAMSREVVTVTEEGKDPKRCMIYHDMDSDDRYALCTAKKVKKHKDLPNTWEIME